MLITLIRNLISAEDKRLVFIMILAYIPALLIAIVMHEFAHGIVAYWNGDDTAKLAGRLNVNPVKHFDPIGFLMLAVIGFGWAKPVPIDPRRFRNYKKGMITVSLAGVVCNFLIAFVATGLFALYLFATKSAVMNMQAGTAAYYAFSFFEYLLVYIVLINLTLMAFNLIPVYPLDGFRLVETLAKPDNRYVAFNYRYGSFLLLGLIVLFNVLGYISPYLDLLGLYMNAIVNMMNSILHAIFGL
ncbi:MAG TPA: site-2 protease family protein [Candidatus Ornithoclostridium faecavium]|nr:site-2 protease family protein [Candidatus Ornithoclostridium faecavium]